MFLDFFDNYAAYEYAIATAQLVLAMLGMGALLTPRDFVREIQNPRGLAVGLGCQWVFVPLIALAIGTFVSMPAGLAAGLIMLAAVPGGTTSNILTLFGRGNIALSISLTSITTVAALATTPIILHLMLSQYLPENFSMPTGSIALDIFGALILPLTIGMIVQRRQSPEFSAIFSRWCIRLSLGLIVIMVIGAARSGRLDAQAYGVGGIMALLLFFLAVEAVGLLVGKAAGLPRKDMLAVLIEAGYRNVSLAVAIKAVVFPAQAGVLDPVGDAVLFAIMLYGGISMILALIPVFWNRRLSESAVGESPAA